ncbi:hypothetical protein [Ancylobacter defluvii]|uniref:Uncharacterized protein n=1 Tax=Ancylobacter defluvii TaxID=1282440 RepID=A0A9W6N9G8_9HYPH|nr:hypothetical protein [Ancylobacter defluvii]MBS7587793.1 hypothetical protein [Ancylobacter defluvii]GLK82603.1 hypothetical protein GCM10017653_06720 [Ancylobacter defluvii]
MTRHFALPPKSPARARLLAGAAVCLGLGLGLAGCAPPGMPKTSVPDQKLAYPSFGAPAQIGTRPVMDATAQAKTQSSLEGLARNHAGQMEQQINQGDDLNAGQ